jgi:uncharacterized membrane protein YqhA
MGDDASEKLSKKEWVEEVFEKFLWNTRLIILLGVFGLLASSAVVFLMGILETVGIVGMFFENLFDHGIHFDTVYNDIIVKIITTVDDFLLGIVLLIFGLGTYDLFISRIDPAQNQDDIRPDWIVFNSLDELKSVLGKVVLMILTITFLKLVVYMNEDDLKLMPLDLLYLGGGIALVSLALRLSHGKDINESTLAERLETDSEFREAIQKFVGGEEHKD